MKALLILVAISLCCCNSQSIPGGYSQVSDADVQNNTPIQSLAQYGAQNIVQQALAEGKLPDSNANFLLTKINSVYQQVVNGINYRFDVTLVNPDNAVIINAVFIIYYQPSTNTRQIISSSYQIPTYSLGTTSIAAVPVSTSNSTSTSIAATPVSTSNSTPTAAAPVSTPNSTPTAAVAQAPATTTVAPATVTQPQPQTGGYTLVSATDVQNSAIIQNLLALGAQNIIQNAVAAKKLPTSNANFTVSKINSVYQQVVNGMNYKFNITLTNSDGVTINANFVVYYQASTNTRLITSLSYSIAPYNAPGTANNSPTNLGWTPLSAADYQNNTIQSLADLGIQNVTQQAIADGVAPSNSQFTISKINTVEFQVVNGINYRFNVQLTNADNSINLVAAYVVYYQSWTNTRKVLSLSYVLNPQ